MKAFNYKGKEHKVFSFTAWGEKVNVILTEETYSHNGMKAIRAYNVIGFDWPDFNDYDLEPYGILTLNVPGAEQFLGENEVLVKTYSENEGWAEMIADMIGEHTGKNILLGHDTLVPIYKVDLSKLYA